MSIYVQGIIYDITGDAENPTVTAKAGWHVNSTENIIGLEKYLVAPKKPKCVFSGVKTYHYCFENEKQAKRLLNIEDIEE
jgi:hypothetical protein